MELARFWTRMPETEMLIHKNVSYFTSKFWNLNTGKLIQTNGASPEV